jgi:proline dehydrogenase
VKAFTFLARRFVAGETALEAVAAGRALHAKGIKATFDLLGEDVLDRDAAKRCAELNRELLRVIPDGIERNVSIKLTTMGLDISEDFCLEQTAGILAEAKRLGGFVRIDMEGSKHTQRTLDAFRRLRRDYDNVGIVLQTYLHRTHDDAQECVRKGDRVRLCKGAYKEPAEVALQAMDDIRANFMKCAELLLGKGNYPALATHDEVLVKHGLDWTAANGVGKERFEFQMLYGLRPRRWEELVKAGYNVRVYVPFGTHWLPYFYRRLRERRENVYVVLRSLWGG